MAPQNKEQLDQKKHERKAQIMRAAIKVFAENGIKLTKISMIAKEAKVSHGSSIITLLLKMRYCMQV
ncbi:MULTISPECIES: TetR/AcrR family transcriptional regulator [unclassified Geomicrobium]|uniref:TetR/AcrR family transcriptional regulator n=1 Tax=unclassified Geomicrobium TaxID=2628951 RepID=UPI00045ED440|nr:MULTISPECIES: TetR family transcriptional regulator [unclassified Geomicrobium]GAK00210.1 hypothetical protein JCM19055_3290 [Geomicrobium sp. JCM 19055]GAK09179.1 hypothetical protein JCM19038_3003 [Geomicrobium sp. JCM 19038]